MTTHHYILIVEDYKGRTEVRTWKIYFFEAKKAEQLYGGDYSKIKYPTGIREEKGKWWRAGRAFVLDKTWSRERRYVGLYLAWTIKDYATYSIIPNQGKEAPRKAQPLVIEYLKTKLKIKKFDLIFVLTVKELKKSLRLRFFK